MTQSAPDPSPCPIETSETLDAEDKLNRHWRGKFLAVLADTSNVTAAAAAAGVPPGRAYKVRRSEPDFARQWMDALCEGYDNLEMELLDRLRFGEDKSGSERRFDNTIALRQLSLHRETVSQARMQREYDDVAAVRASIDAKLARLRDNVDARLKRKGAAR
jgi:hypothetical protein